MTTTTAKRKSIKVEQDGELEYIRIYEVYAIRKNGDKHVYNRYLKRDDAEADAKFLLEVLGKHYRDAFVIEQLVWMKF